MTYFPSIETERLHLRELTIADRKVVYEHFAKPDVTNLWRSNLLYKRL
ncbi:hypothetical protein MHH93_07700 [Priestia sp. FSL H7-0729]